MPGESYDRRQFLPWDGVLISALGFDLTCWDLDGGETAEGRGSRIGLPCRVDENGTVKR
jgi:hypothetical protein